MATGLCLQTVREICYENEAVKRTESGLSTRKNGEACCAMFNQITGSAVDNYSVNATELRASCHETTPGCGFNVLGILC